MRGEVDLVPGSLDGVHLGCEVLDATERRVSIHDLIEYAAQRPNIGRPTKLSRKRVRKGADQQPLVFPPGLIKSESHLHDPLAAWTVGYVRR